MLSKIIKQLRTEKGISQATLALKLGLTQQAIAKWEKGIAEPDSDMLNSLASFFAVSVDYLLGRTSERLYDNMGNFIIGERIKAARLAREMNISELSNKAGISSDDIYAIENGKKTVQMNILQGICSALNITVAELMSEFSLNKISEMKQIPKIFNPIAENLFSDENILETISTNKSFLNENFKYLYYEVPDDYMNILFPKRSIVLVQVKPIVANNDIALLSINGECFIRQFRAQNDTIILTSRSSKEVQDIIININTDNIQIIGKVILSIHFH